MQEQSKPPEPADNAQDGEMIYGAEMKDTIFPYVDNSQHWDIDFNDTNQSYEGSALPAWILGGWAMFTLWSIIYLIVALS